MTDLLRIIYCSRSLIAGSAPEIEAEILRILQRSCTNNAAAGLTGALMFSEDWFAQVLEGPTAALEETFERIQCDRRHHDVIVLAVEPVTEREFPTWAMAYAGISAAEHNGVLSEFAASRGPIVDTGVCGQRILAELRDLVGKPRRAADFVSARGA